MAGLDDAPRLDLIGVSEEDDVKLESGRPPANRLIGEKSPYLRQHVGQPIDWYPWGGEAFSRARQDGKPVFLSIGYSACHWCHVMAEECFQDEEVARFLNEHFVAIKVDREERPDIDHIYMAACQAMTGSGGWPLTVVMTADGQPFFAGTYFPRRSKYGRPGLLEVLRGIVTLWKGNRERLLKTGEQMTVTVQRLVASAEEGQLSRQILEKACRQLEDRFDGTCGGFGAAPKFPIPHNLSLLLRWWRYSGQEKVLAMVEKTLDGLWRGGIYDQLGFGFHRYSTDSCWRVPHFEKMLSDQALLVLAYLEAYQATGHERYAKVAREVITYIRRDMTSPEGGFYSSEDADSEGQEGKYYVWRSDQIESILGKEEGDLFCRFFGVTEEGNFEGGTSVLHRTSALEPFAAGEKMPPQQFERFLERTRQKLFAARQKRIRPFQDDKILTDWNGLTIAALARGDAVLGDPGCSAAAEKAVDFVLGKLRRPGRRLLHRYRDGQAAIDAYLDDYAFLVWGLLELYQATFQARFLREALVLTEDMLRWYWDGPGGAFFFTPSDGEALLARPKEFSDGAIPSGNSVAALNLLRLGRMAGHTELEEKARQVLWSCGAQVASAPTSFSQMLIALDFSLCPTREIVIAGDLEHEDTQRMIRALRQRFLPHATILMHPQGPEGWAIEELVPLVREQVCLHGKATAYVCQNFACQTPTTDVEEMIELIDSEP